MTKLEAAISYALQGWRVIPIKRGCKAPPLLKCWTQEATSDKARINEWFSDGEANIAIATGPESNLFVIDLDRHRVEEDGLKNFHKICAEIGYPPKTLIAKTAGDGLHLLYKHPQLDTKLPKQLMPGIDLQSAGRYVIAVSSEVNEKSYIWKDGYAPGEVELADCTNWLLKALALTPPSSEPQGIDLHGLAPNIRSAEIVARLPVIVDLHVTTPETTETVARLRSALNAISPCISYNEWRNIVFSIKAHGFSNGELIAKEWSTSCVEKFDEVAFTKIWNSDKGRGIGAGTVYYIANEAGWSQPELSDAERAEAVGDINNGRAFAQHFKGRLLYCHAAKKWLNWDRQRWAWCEGGQEVQCAKWVADRLLEDAVAAFRAAPSDGETKTLMQGARSLHGNEKRLQAMLNMAASEDGMGISSPAALDANSWILGVRNGVIDLRTGELLPADPGMLISKQCNATFDEEAQCRRFEKFLHDVFQSDNALIAYVQRMLGYALTGIVNEEVLFFWFGSGANGKSVLVNIVAGVAGTYAGHVSPDLLRAGREAKGSAERATLRLAGLRMALMNELSEGETWDDGKLREITSRERIAARYLYAEAFDFLPTHKLFVRGNNKPAIRDGSDGTWRRLHLVAFDRQFAEDERIPDLDAQILDAERDGILKWLIEGCLQWQKIGLSAPGKVRNAVNQYRKDSDVLGEWMDSHCVTGEFHAEKQSAYRSYSSWSEENGLRPMSAKTLSRRLGERGFELDSGRRNYQGFKVGAAVPAKGSAVRLGEVT